MADYVPTTDGGLKKWLGNLKTNVPPWSLNSKSPGAADEHHRLVRLAPHRHDCGGTAKNIWLAASQAKQTQTDTSLTGLRAEIAKWKLADGMTDAIAAELQIVGGGTPFQPGDLSGADHAQVFSGYVRIKFTKLGADGIILNSRIKGRWAGNSSRATPTRPTTTHAAGRGRSIRGAGISGVWFVERRTNRPAQRHRHRDLCRLIKTRLVFASPLFYDKTVLYQSRRFLPAEFFAFARTRTSIKTRPKIVSKKFHLGRAQSRVPVCFLGRPLGRGPDGECAGRAFSFQDWREVRVRAKQSPDKTNESIMKTLGTTIGKTGGSLCARLLPDFRPSRANRHRR